MACFMTKRQGCHRYECQRGRSLEKSVGIAQPENVEINILFVILRTCS